MAKNGFDTPQYMKKTAGQKRLCLGTNLVRDTIESLGDSTADRTLNFLPFLSFKKHLFYQEKSLFPFISMHIKTPIADSKWATDLPPFLIFPDNQSLSPS